MITITDKIGQAASIDCKPWWTSHAYDCNGKVCVARVHATSLVRRYKTRVEGRLPDYTTGTEAEGFTGDFVACMIDLTQDQIDVIKTNPEYAGLPDPDFCDGIDKPRPKTNTPEKVASAAEQQAAYADLQNEGHKDAVHVDNTPYQKGDDYAQ